MSPPWNLPRADKVTTLHLRTSANYCLCPEFIPPWRCRHFVGGSVLRYAAAAFKASLVKGGASKGGGGGNWRAADSRPYNRCFTTAHNLRDVGDAVPCRDTPSVSHN